MKLSVSFLFLSLVQTSLISAAYKMGVDKPVTVDVYKKSNIKDTNKIQFPAPGTQRSDPEKDVLKDLSERYSVPVKQLQYFRGLHHGYEEIVPALVVAREAQVEAGRVLKMRTDNQSWKKIAETFSIELKPLNEEVLEVLKPIRKVLPEKAMTERPLVRGE